MSSDRPDNPRHAPLTPADVRHMTRVMEVPGHVWCEIPNFGGDMPCVLPNGHRGWCKDARDLDEEASKLEDADQRARRDRELIAEATRELRAQLEQALHRARAAEGEMRAMKDAIGAPEGLWRWLRARFRAKQDEVQRIGEWAMRARDEREHLRIQVAGLRRQLSWLRSLAEDVRAAWVDEALECHPTFRGDAEASLPGVAKAMQALADELDDKYA